MPVARSIKLSTKTDGARCVREGKSLKKSTLDREATMAQYTPDFTLEVEGIKGVCPAGEVYAKQTMAEKKIPIFSCEGPCIRGDITRLAANMVAHDVPAFARACHAETFRSEERRVGKECRSRWSPY